MAKRKVDRKSVRPLSNSASPAEVKNEIDRLDREILKMLNQRGGLAERLGRLKQQQSTSPYDPVHEQQTLAKAAEESKGPLDQRCIAAIFRELLSGSRMLAAPPRIAYLGPQFSYSHLAALQRFGQSAELAPVATIAAVFDEVLRGQVDFGLVPLENSTDGRIADTLGRFARTPVKVCGEVPLRVHHCLLGKCARADVQEVYSKPQALSQCRDWLATHLPSARMIEMTSTAAAARLAGEKAGAAAIASRQAGMHYGLDVIAGDIEDYKDNITRFAVIGNHALPRTGRDKTALMFQLEHKPGALADAMNVFKRNRLNLTWIESFPTPGKTSEYLFFVEMEGHQSESRVRRAIDALARKAIRMEVLGSYPIAAPID